MNTLITHLKGLLNPFGRSTRISYTTYKGFIILDIPVINKKHTSRQRLVERYRPSIDYIILPTNQLLIGFTIDYEQITKAAIELSMQHLVIEQRKSLVAHTHLLNICNIYKENTPYAKKYPELFI